MKKKLIGVLLCTAMVGAMFPATLFAEERTTFTVGFDAEYPPYGYMDENGEYTGFDLELAQAVCDLRGWELVKTPINWDSKDMELESGSIDCIWNGFTINGREDAYTWSVPYVDNSQVIITSKNSGITTLEDLAGKVVGVQAASAALQVLQDEEQQKELADTFATLQEFSDYNSAFVELQAGSVDAIAMDIGVANYQIKSRSNGEDFVILDEHLNAEQYGVGFKKGNTELAEQVNESLMELLEDGTFAELAEKYELTDMVCLGNEEAAEEAETETETAAE
ncbi:MAG: amino acid ABC transporter substrate-binding protein [Eubacteriales bacterium]|nr:amino acid ABC transporter substrate-binding protein [Eubacteriales bacterium]